MASDPANENGQRLIKTNQTPIAKERQGNLNPETQNSKRKKFVQSEEDKEFQEQLYQMLEDEQKKTRELQAELSGMRQQMSALTELINELKETIKQLNSEKNDLQKNNESKKHLKSVKKNQKSKEKTRIKKQNSQQDDEEMDATNTTVHSISDISVSDTKIDELTQSTSKTAMEVDKNKEDEEKQSAEESSDELNESGVSEREYEDNSAEIDTNEFNANEKVKRTNKIPPIDVWTETQQATQLLIRCNMPMYSCVFTKINKTKMRILPKSTEVRNKLICMLGQKNISYNTYTPADEKMVNVLLKGTEISSEKVIENALKRNGITPHRIQRYVTGYMRKNSIESNIWQIVLLPNTDTKELFKIKYIAQWSVKWETMRKQSITQCKRCQRFNHSSSNCSLPYSCVKCTDSHPPGMCELNNTQNKSEPKCVNCKGKHTANNASLCPVFQKEIALREDRKQKKPNNTHTKPNRFQSTAVTQNISYADAVSTNKPKQNKTYPKQTSETENIVRMLQESQQSMQKMMQSFFEGQSKIINALNKKK